MQCEQFLASSRILADGKNIDQFFNVSGHFFSGYSKEE